MLRRNNRLLGIYADENLGPICNIITCISLWIYNRGQLGPIKAIWVHLGPFQAKLGPANGREIGIILLNWRGLSFVTNRFVHYWQNNNQMLNLSLDDQTIFYKSLKWKNLKIGISQLQLIGWYSNFKHKLRWPNHMLQILKMETTSKY